MQLAFLSLIWERAIFRNSNPIFVLCVSVAFAAGLGLGVGFTYRAVHTHATDTETTLNQDERSGYEDIAPETVVAVTHEAVAERQLGLEYHAGFYAEILERLETLEFKLADIEDNIGDGNLLSSPVTAPGTDVDDIEVKLLEFGFSTTEVATISSARSRLQLERLQLRDRAVREGWHRTPDWSREIRNLDSDVDLREILGDQRFDDYLLASGRDNRVRISEVMTGSAAEAVGLQAGDLIYRYADDRVFTSQGLQRLTTDGVAGEGTLLTIVRGEDLIDFTIPRGPLGVTITGISKPGDVLQ